ncbi:MAG: DsbA family protein [Terriglobia bacterium]
MSNSRSWKRIAILVGVVMVSGLILGVRTEARPGSRTLSEAALRAKLVNVLRVKYVIPASVRIAAGPFESSQDPAYYECRISVTNNGQTKSQVVSIAKDGRYLGMSPLFYLGPNTRVEVVRSIRTLFKLGSEWQLIAGPLRPSDIPGFYETTVTAERNGKQQSENFYVTADKHFAILGQVYILRSPAEITRMINTKGQPCSGPADAPVTIVEYADLECPTCARLQPFLENTLLPRYRNKVRLIYKDFPLPMHDWSRKAAVATMCAFQIDPSAYVRYRSSIFAHQSQINVTNLRDQLLSLGEAAGIDRLKLAACIDSNASLPRVLADLREGEQLQVTSTPTCFINGREVVGLVPDDFYHIIDGDLSRDPKRAVRGEK